MARVSGRLRTGEGKREDDDVVDIRHGEKTTAWAIVANKGSFLGLGAEYAQGVKVREQYPSFRSAASRVRVAHLKYEHFCSQ